MPLEQANAEELFQLAQQLRGRRLAHADGFGGAQHRALAVEVREQHELARLDAGRRQRRRGQRHRGGHAKV
jgi:hypothetical protein